MDRPRKWEEKCWKQGQYSSGIVKEALTGERLDCSRRYGVAPTSAWSLTSGACSASLGRADVGFDRARLPVDA